MQINNATEILPAGPQAPSQARRFVSGALSAWKRSDLRERAVLAVSELVTNAFLYGEGDIVLVVTLGTFLRVEVRDEGAGVPAQRHYSPTSTTGRGLHLVGHVADRWGTSAGAGNGNEGAGKVVWFEIDTPVPGQAPATLDTMAEGALRPRVEVDLRALAGEVSPGDVPGSVQGARVA